MMCPVCKDKKLVVADRQGIEIDYCPQCRGVWLDRGELDKIIERSSAMEERVRQEASQPVPPPVPTVDSGIVDPRAVKVQFLSQPGKRKGLLSELLDFD